MNYEQLMNKKMDKRTFLTSLLSIMIMLLILPNFNFANREETELNNHIKIIED